MYRAVQGTMVRVICGPPCAGKTTYVREHQLYGDLVIDLDAILAALTLGAEHTAPGWLVSYALEVKATLLGMLNRPGGVRRAWVIDSAPSREMRAQLRAAYNATVILLNVDKGECLRRAEARPNVQRTEAAIEKWFEEYTPD